jgi:hypothetical protein
MTRNTSILIGGSGPDPDDMSHLDADVRSLAAGLDALGAADRAGPNAGFEDRLMQATLASLHGVEPVAAQAAELGAMDRAAAPDDLEDGVFAESVPALRDGAVKTAAPVLRHVGEPQRVSREHVRVVRKAWWANQYYRLAAAIVLVAGVGFAVRTGMSPGPTAPSDQLADRVSRDMDLLFTVMEGRSSGETPDNGSSNDPDELTRWLIEGASS